MAIDYIKAKNGMHTVEYEGYLLHSKYNPQREAQMFVEKNIEPYKLNIIFGYGLGYVAQEIKSLKVNSENVLFIEPIPELKHTLSSDFEVLYTTNLMDIRYKIEQRLSFFDVKINVIHLPNYNHLFLQAYNDLLTMVAEVQNLNLVYENTVYKSSESWQKNNIYSVLYALKNHSIEKLKDAYNVPVIIASGGPSLSKQLNMLKEIRSSVLLIASGSTVSSLIAEAIEPDYIVTIDGGMKNYERHFKSLNVREAELIFTPSSNYNIQKEFPNREFLVLHHGEKKLQKYLKEQYDFFAPTFIGGGSVANFALEIAMYITNGPIAIIGQDLAYTNNMTHAENNKNAEKIDIKTRKDIIKTKGYYDNIVFTDYSLLAMKRHFEMIVGHYPEENVRLFNCTEGGVKIEGLQQCAFNHFVSNFVDTQLEVKKINVSIKNNGNEQFIKQMQEELKIYQKIKQKYVEALRLLKSNSSTTQFSQNVLSKLDSIDGEVIKLKQKVILERIDDPISLFVMNKFKPNSKETAEEIYQRVYKQNLTLYKFSLEALEKTITYTKEVIVEAKENIL